MQYYNLSDFNLVFFYENKKPTPIFKFQLKISKYLNNNNFNLSKL